MKNQIVLRGIHLLLSGLLVVCYLPVTGMPLLSPDFKKNGVSKYCDFGLIAEIQKTNMERYSQNVNTESKCDYVKDFPIELDLELRNESDVILKWKSEYQTGDVFIVSKSLDGLDYETIGYLVAYGEEGMVNNYSHLDVRYSKKEVWYQVSRVSPNNITLQSHQIKCLDLKGKAIQN